MTKFKVGDLVRWKAATNAERPHLGIVLVERPQPMGFYSYKVQWFTDNNRIGTHHATLLTKAEVEGG